LTADDETKQKDQRNDRQILCHETPAEFDVPIRIRSTEYVN
jgi:hypothetical protein